MARSYGSAATLLALKETTYGLKPAGNWEKFAFVSCDLSAEQALLSSDLLGQGREPRAPFRDVIKDEGNLVVPVEGRDFGRWLQFLMGNPTSVSLSTSAKQSSPSLSGNRYTHTFISGAPQLPSFALEIGHVNVPTYFVHTGCMLNSMALNFQRSGAANATLNILAQGEKRFSTTQGGTSTRRNYKPFSQFNGAIKRNGVPLANITSAQFTYSNGLEAVSTIRNDGLIEAVDPTIISLNGTIEARFADNMLLDDALHNNAIELELAYRISEKKGNGETDKSDGEDFSLTWTFHEVYLPRPRLPISGPGGVQVSFNWQAVYNEALGKSVTVLLNNDVPTYLQ